MPEPSCLTGLIRAEASPADLGRHLDELTAQARVRECLAVPGSLLPQLYERVKGHRSLDIETFVAPPQQTVIYELKNSLPVMNVAQKRFFRPTEGETVGYNHTSGLARLAGPGYFIALNGDDGELVFDYTRLPDLQPPGWPSLRAPTGLVARATYGNMIDYVRALGAHTAIGAAFRGGRPRNAFFLLTRSAAQS